MRPTVATTPGLAANFRQGEVVGWRFDHGQRRTLPRSFQSMRLLSRRSGPLQGRSSEWRGHLAPSKRRCCCLPTSRTPCSNGTDYAAISTTPTPSLVEAAKPDAMSRPLAVAWTSARAKRRGFSFDPAKLRTLYLAYEAKQGAMDEAYAKMEKAYDTSYRLTLEKVSSDPNYCTEQKQRQIKANLERHIVGDYSANLPPPKSAAACKSWLGCTSGISDEPFDGNKFWREKESEPKPW